MMNYPYLIPLFPLMAFAANILFGKKLGKKSALVSIAASTASAALSISAFVNFLRGSVASVSFAWLNVNGAPVMFGILVDQLSLMMLLVVSVIGTLIQVYSTGYMSDDKRFSRFFAYMSLFMFSMLSLVLSNNFMMIYIFWELVGVCSYFLISFWFEKDSAANAGKKAFITTRIGDVGLFIGLAMIFWLSGSPYFSDLPAIAQNPDRVLLTAAAILIFCGAVGKSAQFPLHVWLPDAMEGPTPVSALIHAATMVAAGVYLVARCYPLFAACPAALVVVAYIGIVTAFMAGTIALVVNDIKRILAYSTISQLGYMIAALGCGGYTAGTFHLMTHAFFKALLFLGAGSVIHGVHTQDIRQMGGIFSKMKITAATFIIASLAIAGVPPLAGFWSKDEILVSMFASGNYVIFGLAYLTSIFTAFYMFRLCFIVFFGRPRKADLHAHESPAVMTVPLMVLAFFSIFIGLVGSPLMHNWFGHFVTFGEGHHGGAPAGLIMGASVAAGVIGIAIAFALYILKWQLVPQAVRIRFTWLHTLLINKYYMDEIYLSAIIRPIALLSKYSFRFDKNLIDGVVNWTGLFSLFLSEVKNSFDKHVVDGLVNGAAKLVDLCSGHARRLQTGLIQNYMLFIIAGLVIILFVNLIR
ncbi:MAG TPA: NADH-quinone oxidoreductase subunit L [bacterium]|nr:NADH-quinone oxidoreductase subunit L [bacterium]